MGGRQAAKGKGLARSPCTPQDCTDILPSIKAAKTPSIVLSGKSQFNPADKVKEAEAMGGQVIDYEYSGHMIHLTEPAKVIADMVAFIKSL